MLDCLTNPLTLPKYSQIIAQEGKGNWAVKKYYQFPYRYFYRHKIRMLSNMMRGNSYKAIMDFGSGPGMLSKELLKYSDNVKTFDIGDTVDPRWRFDAVVCSSVLEFTNLYYVLKLISLFILPDGHLYVVSPMDTKLTRYYFKSIKDTHLRHSQDTIKEVINRYFIIKEYKEWMGLYFALRAVKR